MGAETELFLKQVTARTAVRIVSSFSDLLLNPEVDHDKLTKSYMAMLDFLVTQLEGSDPTVRGHSSTVAKYCNLVGHRMGLSPRELDALNAAAFLHDLDSLITHRSLTKVTQDNNGVQLPSYEKTADLLSKVPFPFSIAKLLLAASRSRHSAEDGEAPPPLAARILRIADVYDTLRRTNPDVNQEEAFFHWMRGQPTGMLDAHALEIFIHLRKNERMLSSMDIFFAKVLLIEPHPEDVRQLQLRLENDDHKVIVVSSIDAAMQVLAHENVTLVISEFEFPGNDNGLRLLRMMKLDSATQHIPFFFHAAADTARIKHALELGAEDWFSKPSNVDIIAMKIDRLINRLKSEPNSQTEGVRGTVRDMGMIEMVQILGAANRSVQISLERDGAAAQMTVHKGRIVSAALGELNGNEAAIELLLWEEGSFHILPLKNAPSANVTMNTDNLIMESCLRKDSRAANRSNGNGATPHSSQPRA